MVDNLFENASTRMTATEFFAFTQQTDRLYQLLNGRPMMNPAPLLKHQRIVGRPHILLDQFVASRALGEILLAPCDVVFDRFNVAQPDMLFIAAEQTHITTEKNVQGAPDLIVEIPSASTADLDRGYKQYLYTVNGVREYWLIDPDALQIEVLTQGESGYARSGVYGEGEMVVSPLLSGLCIAVDDIFAGV